MSSRPNVSYLHYAIGASDGHVYQEEITRFIPTDFPTTDVARYTITWNDLVSSPGRDGSPEFYLEIGLRRSLWQALVRTVNFLFRSINGLNPSAGGDITTCPIHLPDGLCRNLHMLPPTLPPLDQLLHNPFELGMDEGEVLDFAYEWQGLLLKLQAWITEAQRRIELNPNSFSIDFSPLPTINWDEVAVYDAEKRNDMDTLVKQLGDEYFELNFSGNSSYALPIPLATRMFIAGLRDTSPVRVVDTGSEVTDNLTTPSPEVSPPYSPSIPSPSSLDEDPSTWNVDHSFEAAYPEVVRALTGRRPLLIEWGNDE